MALKLDRRPYYANAYALYFMSRFRGINPVCLQTMLLRCCCLALPAAVQAQFTYTTNNGTITITGYTGSGGAVTIPGTINGLPVTSIGD